MTKFEELTNKLRELFELDKADLDFGIHRIIKSKHEQVDDYLQNRLPAAVQEALGALMETAGGNEMEALAQQIRGDFGNRAFDGNGELVNEEAIAYETGQRYLELRANPAQAVDGARIESEVYSHLYNFFSRYYEDADFMSLRRHSTKAKYSIPYSGEEVVLHWANKDQYYIKSSEDLKDYAFSLEDGKQIHFKLTRMDAVQNNNKAVRIFTLDEEEEIQATDDLLVIPFHFAEGKKRTNPQSVAWELEVLDGLPDPWKEQLSQTDATFTGTGARNILQKHLRNYTKKNTSDYFIHKDLGGFLNEELDFYIKNEVMYLDDVDNRPADYLEAEIRKIKAIRKVAKDLIDFLAQFEEFQKKLWLKKKFVLESNWCITLDRIIEQAPTLLEEITGNDQQWAEWEKLGFLFETTADAEELGLGDQGVPAVKTVDYLKAFPYMVIDTAFYGAEFKYKLLAAIPDIDQQMDGLLIHSENFQALNLIGNYISQKVSNVFIDPPYNTGDDGFVYKDRYQSSSWLSMMSDRVDLGMSFLKDDGVFFASIGDEEQEHLSTYVRHRFGKDNFFANLIWEKKKKGSFLNGKIVRMKDYILCIAKNEQSFGGLIGEIARETETYPVIKTTNARGTRVIKAGIPSKYRERNHHLPAGTRISSGNMELILETDLVIQDGILAEDVTVDSNWIYGQDSLDKYSENKSLYITQDLYFRRVVDEPRYKRMRDLLPRAGDEGEADFRAFDVENLNRYGWGSNEDANDELHQLLGKQYAVSYPKPSKLLTLLCAATRHDNGYWLDYYAGSGTTAHAVINLNRDDHGTRKYALVEMGDYFNPILKPRVQKAVFSDSWNEGKAINPASGISHCFKYMRLESYEDALNNLAIEGRADDLLALGPDVQEDYLLRYMLDVETRGSLLNLDRFVDPFSATLRIYNRETGAAEPKPIDLPETFNYLLGLRVREMMMRDGFLTIEGENPAGETVLVIWRNVQEKDNAALDAFVTGTLRINTADTEYKAIYINGDTTLNDPHKKIMLTEEVFHNLMFDVTAL